MCNNIKSESLPGHADQSGGRSRDLTWGRPTSAASGRLTIAPNSPTASATRPSKSSGFLSALGKAWLGSRCWSFHRPPIRMPLLALAMHRCGSLSLARAVWISGGMRLMGARVTELSCAPVAAAVVGSEGAFPMAELT